jgi:hypothetical protein
MTSPGFTRRFLSPIRFRSMWWLCLCCRFRTKPESTADETCARDERDLRAFAKKAGYKIVGVWNEIAPGQSRSAPNARRSWHWRRPARST